jgi:hypothetical protein
MTKLNFKLRKPVKKAWLKALRSGEYKQARYSLRRETPEGGYKYCCLGVLCDLHRKIVKKAGANWTRPSTYGEDDSYVLPIPVIKWAFEIVPQTKAKVKKRRITKESLCGLADPILPDHTSLVDLNDKKQYSFTKIAQKIEKYL